MLLATGFSLALDGLALAPTMSLDTVDLIAIGGPLSALGNRGEGVLSAAGVCRLPPGWGATGWQGDAGAVAEGGRCRLQADASGQRADLAAAGPSARRAEARAVAAQDEALGRTFDRGFAGRSPWEPEGGAGGSGAGGGGGGEAWPGGGDPAWPVDPGGGFAPPAVAFLGGDGGGGGGPGRGDRGGGAAGPSGGFSPSGGLPGAGGVPGTVLGASGAQPNGTPVPAPNGAAVLAVGLAGLAWLRRRPGRAVPGRRMSPNCSCFLRILRLCHAGGSAIPRRIFGKKKAPRAATTGLISAVLVSGAFAAAWILLLRP